MNLEKLLNKARDGDTAAFAAIYGEYKERLYRYACYRIGDAHASEDAVSECVLDAWRGIAQLKDPQAFEAWLFQILRRKCAAQIRRIVREKTVLSLEESREQAGEQGEQRLFASSETDEAELAADRMTLTQAMSALSDQEKDIVLMKTVLGMNSPEISAETGLTPGSVRSKLARSLSKLRTLMEKNT